MKRLDYLGGLRGWLALIVVANQTLFRFNSALPDWFLAIRTGHHILPTSIIWNGALSVAGVLLACFVWIGCEWGSCLALFCVGIHLKC